MHSIIAKNQFPKFIQVLFDLYIKDLEEDVSDEIVLELLKYLHKLFKNYQDQDDIEFEFRGSKMTVTNQQLPKSFKKAFLINWSRVAGLVKRYFLYFDILMKEEPLSFKSNDYYDHLFNQHLTEIGTQLEIQKILQPEVVGRNNIRSHFLNWKEHLPAYICA